MLLVGGRWVEADMIDHPEPHPSVRELGLANPQYSTSRLLPPVALMECPYTNSASVARIISVTVGKGGSAVIRLLIADEHEVVRSGLRAILEAQPNWVVIAEAVDGKEAILKAIEVKPDVAVINSVLPLISGIEVTRQIRMRFRSTEVLVFDNR